MARVGESNTNKNRNSSRWLMVGLYPLALFVLFFGVFFFDWMAEGSESNIQDLESFSDRDADDILERLGLNDIVEDKIIEVDDIKDICLADVDDINDADVDVDIQSDRYYYYSLLSEDDKKFYYALCKSMENVKNNMGITFKNIEDAERIYYLVKGDHPEYFYVNGFTYITNSNDITICPIFSYDEGEIISKKAMIEMEVNNVIDRMPSGMDEYEIVKYCFEWIVNNTDYVFGCDENQEMTSVFINHESVCSGYTRAMQYLLQKCNIQAMYVGGYAGGEHAWLIICVDGDYYNLDVTWADSTNPDAPHPDYTYLLLTTERICRTHTVNTDIYPVPNCISMDSNFYIRENFYVTNLNDNTLQEIFDRSKLQYNGTVYMMASDAGMYKALTNYLIDEGNVYRFYYGEGDYYDILHVGNDDLYTLSFFKK